MNEDVISELEWALEEGLSDMAAVEQNYGGSATQASFEAACARFEKAITEAIARLRGLPLAD